MFILNRATFAGWAHRLRRSWIAIGILVVSMTAAFVMLIVVDAVLVHALPYPDSNALVAVTRLSTNGMKVVPDISYARWASQAGGDAALAAYQSTNLTRSTAAGMERVRVARATPSLFEVLGIRVQGGRALRQEDTEPGAPFVAVAVAAADELGRQVVLDGREYAIVGTLSETVTLPNGTSPAIIVPMTVSSAPAAGRPVRFINQIVARLSPGVSMATLAGRLADLDSSIRDELPRPMAAMWNGSALSVTSLQDDATKAVRQPILALQGATVALLLIAILNVAALQMVVILGRQTEVGTRIALGASPSQIAAGLMIESTGAVVMSGLVAAGLATLIVRTLPAVLLWDPVARIPAWGVSSLLAAGATVMLASIACAVTSASVLRLVYRRNTYGAWRRVSAGMDARRLYGFLVAGQIAVAVVLAAAALLLFRTYGAIAHVERGFDARNVLSANLSFQGPEFANDEALNAVAKDIVNTLRDREEVAAVSLATTSPAFMPIGLTAVAAREAVELRAVQAGLDQVSPDYFTVARIPLLRGRVFSADDVVIGPKLAVISEALAAQLFGNGEPVGRTLTVGDQAMTVVGVAGNVRSYARDPAPLARVYAWFAQQPSAEALLTVRTVRAETTGSAWLESAVRSTKARVVVYGSAPLERQLDGLTATERLRGAVASALALVAAFIALAGVFGLASYYALTRRRDMAIRAAIGALPNAILRLQLLEGVKLGLMACGLAVPIIGAAWMWLGPWVARPRASDAIPMAALGTGILIMILFAFLPSAYRASRVDPVAVLSQE
jgi:putative ABC transport system permease protein